MKDVPVFTSKMTVEPETHNPHNKPVIISEFGGGAKSGYHGAKNQRWTEEFQENLYRENIAMIDKIDGLAGTTPWILKDFRSPRRVLCKAGRWPGWWSSR